MKRIGEQEGGRPKRSASATKAPHRFAFSDRDGYTPKFRAHISKQLLKDVDDNWEEAVAQVEEEVLSEPEEVQEEYNSADLDSDSEDSQETNSVDEDNDEYIGERDSDLSSSEVVDLNNLPEDDEEEEDDDEEEGEISDSEDD